MLNITAIFTLEQIKEILESLGQKKHILSVFSGRIYDIGLNAANIFKEITDFTHSNSKCETLWASCRMPYDVISAANCNGDIITMTPEHVRKLKKFGKSLNEYSLETVKGFYNDAKKAGFTI